MRKSIVLFLFVFFSTLVLFSYLLLNRKTVNSDNIRVGESSPTLYFTGRYLTDKELSQLPQVKIDFNNYDSLSHVFPQNGLESVYRLSHFYQYNSKFFRMEDNSGGLQWIHLSMDSKEKVEDHKYLKNYLKTKKFSSIGNPFYYNFRFCFTTDKNDDSVQLFHIYTYEPLKKSIFQIFCKNGFISLKFPVELEGKSLKNETIFLGDYILGDVGKISFQFDGKKVLVSYNDKKVFNREVLPEIIKSNAAFYIANGLYPGDGSQGFSEVFLSDIDYNGD